MARSNDEIYEVLCDVRRDLAIHLAVHAEREKKSARRWQVWMAVVAAALAAPMATVAIVVSAIKG